MQSTGMYSLFCSSGLPGCGESRALTPVGGSSPLWREQARPIKLGGYFNLVYWVGGGFDELLYCDVENTFWIILALTAYV